MPKSRRGNYAAFRARMRRRQSRRARRAAGRRGRPRRDRARGGAAFHAAPAAASAITIRRRPIRPPRKPWRAQRCRLDDLLRAADIVTLHVPLLPATKGLIGARELASMKPDAVLIQASRGGIVDEAGARRLRCAPAISAAPRSTSSPPSRRTPTIRCSNSTARPHRACCSRPHIAGVTRQSAAFLFRAAWRNVERVLIENAAPLNRAY